MLSVSTMHHDAIEKHVNKRLEYSSATKFLIPTGHKIGQKSVQIIVLLRGDVTKRKKRDNGSWSLFTLVRRIYATYTTIGSLSIFWNVHNGIICIFVSMFHFYISTYKLSSTPSTWNFCPLTRLDVTRFHKTPIFEFLAELDNNIQSS